MLERDLDQEIVDFFAYFNQAAQDIKKSHAEKSDINMEGTETSKRLMKFIPIDTTPLHLLTEIDKFSSPKNYERAVLAEILYVQSMVEQLIFLFESRLATQT